MDHKSVKNNFKITQKALRKSAPFFLSKKEDISFRLKREKYIFAAGKKAVFSSYSIKNKHSNV
ncbi:hypothetical protein DX873_09375 [Flagellimonas nanhaiensis]|uniref:Uncharacterized protein n=1 Tax=Flagellimonas nanhaiensis TaxID=2292706 RepID=A0A371JQ31_9FLAO|nr:hypothetical protein DX873_09375 [Allomuricauda nanhaiensis]